MGSLRRTGLVIIRLCKVEVIANSSKLPMLPHEVLQMALTEGMQWSIVSQAHHLGNNSRLLLDPWKETNTCHWPGGHCHFFFFLHAGLATIIHFISKPNCWKLFHLNNTLMPDLLGGHLLCKYINHLDLHLKEGWQYLGHVILSSCHLRRRAWSKKHSPLPPKMLC